MQNIIAFIVENWILILSVLLVILEAILRLKPSDQNWSLLHFFIGLIDLILPNKAVYSKEDSETKAKFRIRKELI